MEHKSRDAVWILLFITFQLVHAQGPPRLNIPGAVLVSQPKPYRPQRISQPLSRPPPPRELRPVFEESEENEPPSSSQFLDDEVNKLGLAALQSAVRQNDEENNAETEPPRPLQFRPERPLPVLRQDIREGPRAVPRPAPPRAQFREELQQQRLPPLRQVPQARPAPPPQQSFRQTSAVRAPPPPARAAPTDYEDDSQRKRKPPVQILRKYRVDNEDGSITWGFENEDGTFKEETLGADCISRGKYGYIDPDGVKREYSYETGNKCDEPEEEELPEQLPPQQGGKFAQPLPRKQQYRPQPV